MYFHHSIDYPDGTTVKGKVDHRGEPSFLGVDVRGKRVLDIATNDGMFAFWAEQNGAREVVAIDVDTYDKYDWGFNGPPEGWEELAQQNKATAFWHHHQEMQSEVRKLNLSVNELDPETHGSFDVVINYGLLYHLRHPLLSLDKCRAVTAGMMALETHIRPNDNDLPYMLVAGSLTGILGPTDYLWPTESAVCAWLLMADFPEVYAQRRETKKSPFRQRFLACVSEEQTQRAEANPNFRRVTAEMIQQGIKNISNRG